jgi:hypothetical protein
LNSVVSALRKRPHLSNLAFINQLLTILNNVQENQTSGQAP